VQFIKGHGTGNDFVILPDPDGTLSLTPSLVADLCDRHFGIGADGVLHVVRSAKHPDAAGLAAEAEWFMDYWNADGSIAEMCGNGVRVFTRYLLAGGLAASPPSPDGLPIATRAGVVVAVVDSETIAVRMTPPRRYATSTASLGALIVPGAAVDCGNPHLVCHVSAPLETLDLHIAPGYDPAVFPHGVNVEFARPATEPVEGADRHVRMRVFERGSGETLSCGTGALAVGAVALADAGLAAGTVAVDLPGGRLTVTHTPDGEWWLAGPAVLVAAGDWTAA
jgi:diaminopimelate epimerase